MAEKIKIFEIEVGAEKAVANVIELRKDVAKLKEETKKAKEANGEFSAEFVKSNAELKATQKELRQAENLTQKLTVADRESSGTRQKLTAQNAELRSELQSLDLTQQKGIERQTEINETLDRNSQFLKENSDQYLKTKLNVGNYTESIIDAVKILKEQEATQKKNLLALQQANKATNKTKEDQDRLNKEIESTEIALISTNKELKKYGQNLGVTDAEIIDVTESTKDATDATEEFGGAFGSVTEGAKRANTVFKLIAKNPLIATLSALAAILTAVFASFKKTQKGADSVNKIMAVLTGVFDVFTGILAKGAELLIDFFENPKQSINDFGTLVKENIVNRIEGLVKLLPRLGEALSLLFEGEFSEAAKVAGDAVVQVGLGVENFSDKATDAFNEVVEAVEESAEASLKYQNATIGVENAIIETTKSLAKLNKESEIQRAIADDNTRSFEEREIAAKNAQFASEEAAKVELTLTQQQLSLQRILINQKRANGLETRELRQAEADAIAMVIDAEKNLSLIEIENNKLREEIARDTFEKNLDFIIEKNTLNLQAAEQELSLEQTTFDRKKEIIEATRELVETNFKQQVEAIQSRTQEQIDINELLAESDANRLIEKVRLLKLDEIEETRLLEILKENSATRKDLNDAELLADQEREILKANFEANEETRRQEIQSQTLLGKLDLERQALEAKEAQEVAFAEKIGASTTLIEKKYSNARKEINKAEQKAKLSLASDFLGNIAAIAGEGTAVGKAAAVAQTTVSTFQAAQGAYASLAPIPIVGPVLGIAAAGAAVAAGVANVKNILKVKSGLPEKSISGSTPSTPSIPSATSISTNIPSQNVSAEVGQGIVSRDSVQQEQTVITQPVLVTEEVTFEQDLSDEISQVSAS